jgi:GNAT superfamily N-acetyltransferase
MKIRQANLADLNEVAVLFDGYRQFYKQAADMKLAHDFLKERIMNEESVIFVCEDNGKMVGFTQLYPSFSSVSARRTWILNDLFVLPEMRGKGYGESLLLFAQDFCKQQNHRGLALQTATDNPAQKLYERMGWELDKYLNYFWANK